MQIRAKLQATKKEQTAQTGAQAACTPKLKQHKQVQKLALTCKHTCVLQVALFCFLVMHRATERELEQSEVEREEG